MASIAETTVTPTDPNGDQPTVDSRTNTDHVGPDPQQDADKENCVYANADQLTRRYAKYGRDFRVTAEITPEGVPARELFEAADSDADFATYEEVRKRLRILGDGSSAIIASSWAGQRQGGHTYLAVNDGNQIYLIDRGIRSPWPPDWGEQQVSQTAVGYLDKYGNPESSLADSAIKLKAADAIGFAKGHPDGGYGSSDGDGRSGDQWRDEVSQRTVAENALAARGLTPDQADQVRNPLGLMEAASERSRDNATWWDSLTGREQRALIETYPQDIGNAEGIPATARHAANTQSMKQERAELQKRLDRGERLTRDQRKQLARLDRIQQALDKAGEVATQAGVKGPLLIAFDPTAFGGDGRALVSFGTTNSDPYQATSVAWHVPGRGMDIDQIGPVMGDALNQLRSTLAEEPKINAASIAWIGYDTASGWKGFRAAGSTFAAAGGAILYSDIRAFNTAHDIRTPDDKPFSGNHIFGHSYGSTTTSHAAKGGRLARQVSTVTLIGSPGAGPLQQASDAGIGAENFYVASSSRDPYTVLGGRTPGSSGRLFGFGLGVDPSMQSFGAQRIAAEFSAEMDSRRTNLTHNAYYRYVDRSADPPVRTESLANFGRIAAEHDVSREQHRTVDERPRHQLGWRTIEPADGRALRLDDDIGRTHAGDRDTRRLWNPRFRTPATEIDGHTSPNELSTTESDTADGTPSPADVLSTINARTARELADHALRLRVPPVDAVRLANPLGEAELAVGRAEANAKWWASLSDGRGEGYSDAQKALLATYPAELGNAEGIPPLVRHEANNSRLQEDLARRDDLVNRRDNGLPLNREQVAFMERMKAIEDAMRSSAKAAHGAEVGGPYLLAYDRDAFGGNGRAIICFGDDPYKAESVSWYIPGMTTKIDKLRTMALRAVHQLESVKRTDQNLSASSLAYIGYNAPGSFDPRVAFPTMARAGGETLYSDIAAFNAGRDAYANDGSHFSGNHIFAHSYGSASISYAGEGQRLRGQVTTITLIGSPGAGPLKHAADFGIGNNVFVAASSRDEVTSFGSDKPGGRGRAVDKIGLGVDPAMESFGARRVTSEFTAEMDHVGRGSRGTHSTYWSYAAHDGEVRVRSESLANFGRIAANQGASVIPEQRRTLVEGARNKVRAAQRTYDPAVGRPLLYVDDPGHPRRNGPRHLWNPGWNTGGPGISTPIGHLDADGNPVGFPKPDEIGRGHHDAGDDSTPAQRALRQRVPPLTPAELASPLGRGELAATRAQANAEWWNRLSSDPEAHQALLRTHPYAIGNADGIPADVRDTANHRVLQGYRDRANGLRADAANGRRLKSWQRKWVERVRQIDAALQQAAVAAERAGHDRPLLLAFDPGAFGGKGRVLLSFGADPYHAQAVSWHVGRHSIDGLQSEVGSALTQLQANLDQVESASAIVWVGDEASKVRLPWASTRPVGPDGVLYSDLAAFRAVRNVFGAGDPLVGSRVYAGGSAAHSRTLWLPPDAGSQVVAHRGASHEFPEQTLAAYEEALRQGANALECDIHLTKDGQLICLHDKKVDRTSNGSGDVSEMTLAQLQALDFGGWHPSAELGDAQGDTGILTLERLLELVNGRDQPVTLFIEIKQRGGELETALVDLLNRTGLANPASPADARVAVISFYPDALVRVHRGAPNVPTVQLGLTQLGSITRHVGGTIGATAIGPSIAALRANPEMVELAAARGMATYCWTVNDQADVQFARDLGVTWIATDHPGRTSAWLQGEATIPTSDQGTPGDVTESQSGADTTPVSERSESEAEARVKDALAQRVPPVTPGELRNPLGPMEEARARARNNAAWWKGLTPEQRQLLIDAHPADIGNAEGIPPADRDAANNVVLRQLRDQADRIQTKIDQFERPTRAERKLLARVNKFEAALDKARRDAQRAGVDGPLLLAFDPAEFGGDGRAVLSFGHDPYDADSVSWHVPGIQTTLRSLFGFYTGCALNHLQSTMREKTNLKAASIAWIGYDTPSGLKLVRMINQSFARVGGDILFSDISAFNAGRATTTGGHFDGNHVFGYSYGSTATAHAGRDARLAGQIRTVSLVGSPGAGPVQHARDFGLDQDNVFAASSSRDLVTALGGRTTDSTTRILSPIARLLGLGLGVDPTMDFFGAVRVTAEVPAAMNRPLIGGTHHAYFLHANAAANPRVRSEALVNLGRIAAEQSRSVSREHHRTEGERRGLLRTVDPAGDRSVHRVGNPMWRDTADYRTPEFGQSQQHYRAMDPETRQADTRYADRLGEVVDGTDDVAAATQLASDLSGQYGPYRIRLEALRFGSEVRLSGVILNGDTEIGTLQWIFDRDADGKLVATNSGLVIQDAFKAMRGKGFSRAYSGQFERYFVRSGVDRIELKTHDKGGYAWPRQGFTWNTDPQLLQESLDSIKRSAAGLSPELSDQSRAAIDDMVARLNPSHPRLPEPIDIANLATPDDPHLGQRLLERVGQRQTDGFNLVRYMPLDTEFITSRPPGRFKSWLAGVFERRTDPNCGHDTIANVAQRYGRDIRVAVPRSRTGLPAWAVFDAVGSSSDFVASHDEVAAELRKRHLGPGSAAVLSVRWSDGRTGGHAYLAVNDGGRIYLEERRNGRTVRSDWPPYWGDGAVSRIAVGYLDSDGNAVRPLHDVPLRLAAADAIGDVQGVPDDPDFLQRQADYRAEDLTSREVDTRYAEPLGDVVDNASDLARAVQLALDLSGRYGPYHVIMGAEVGNEGVVVSGPIFNGDEEIGLQGRTFYRDTQPETRGELVVFEDLIGIDDEDLRGKGFSKAVIEKLGAYYVASGVDRVELKAALDNGGYAWARQGFTWLPHSDKLQESLDNIAISVLEMLEETGPDAVGPQAKAVLAAMLPRLDPEANDIPEPMELAMMTARDEPKLGYKLMNGVTWWGALYVKDQT
ncbi:alpha/beta hydrolase [Mycobacterium neglectum]|uniref:alpha/beta hydrolase n=1 Tax=Mycobacterium neglectum TaxID=242737 RepID=UPI00159BCC1A